MKLCQFILFLLSMAFASSTFSAGETLKINLSKMYLTSIKEFNRQVVIEFEDWSIDDGYKLKYPIWKLDRNRGRLAPFKDINSYPVIATFSNRKGTIKAFASRNGKAVFLNFPDEPKRNKVLRIDEDQPFKIVANKKFTYLIFQKKIMLLTESKTETTPLEELDIKSRSSLPRGITISDETLYLGYYFGEFGGGLSALKFDSSGTFTKNYDMMGSHPTIVALDSENKPFVVSNLAHLSSISAGLYYLDDDKIENVIQLSGSTITINNIDKPTNSGVITLPQTTEIDGLVITDSDEAIVLASSIGILSIKNKKTLRYLWKGDLFDWFQGEGFTSADSPIGLVKLGDSLFTATKTRGILEFSRQKNGEYLLANTYPIQ